MTLEPVISDAEAAIALFEEENTDDALDNAREKGARALLRLLGWLEQENDKVLDEILNRMVLDERINRDALLFTARLASIADFLPKNQFQHRFISHFEQTVPDLSRSIELSTLKQTVDKMHAVSGLHSRALQLLEPISHLSSVPLVFVTSKQSVFQILNNNMLKSYLRIYNFVEKSAYIREIYTIIEEVISCKDATFVSKLELCESRLSEISKNTSEDRDFFSTKVFTPYLVTAQTSLAEIRSQSIERFYCRIRSRRPAPNVIERRFPLHEANRVFRATIPFVNDGPGLAVDTVVTVVTDDNSLFLQDERLSIGTVEPGDFAVTFEFLVGDPVEKANLLVEVSWSTAQATSRNSNSFEVILTSQDPTVSWDLLEADDPYSTEVAQGDEFVGRQAKVAVLEARLRRARMQSSYITGQKRVGKTSLAFAVRDNIVDKTTSEKYIFIYLEYGDYASSDSKKTLESLGKAIFESMVIHLPIEKRTGKFNFDGTIAPLNGLANALAAEEPRKRFVIILDEFDEIHPEMYRYGSLAEAFFSNLRTLSAKPNIAMMLVGGENMPFIISAQGDQLNKYVPEQLSYFSRSLEWEDYVDIVRLKNNSPLTWYESALSEIFRVTNGHPYYTKLLCARIFQTAVQDRDTEVTLEEVGRGVRVLIDTLDTNSFAHFWKDGIAVERDKAEAVEAKRKQVLVAVGQTKRSNLKLNLENISTRTRGLAVQTGEVPAILNDFIRREILRERDGEYGFILPLFEEWLTQRGVGKLISDTLGDEIAEALRIMEDEAFVTANEIAEAIASWPPYRGRERSVGDIQAWLEQRESIYDRRLLFKMLKSFRFVREEEVREKLRTAHNIVKQHMSAFTPENRSQRRFDIVVTYIDGVAKSGAKFAEKYAEVNLISNTCVVERGGVANSIETLEKGRGQRCRGIVIIDDVAATGNSISKNIEEFIDHNTNLFVGRRLPIVIIVLLATKMADQSVRQKLSKFKSLDIDFRVCEYLDDRSFAFAEGSEIWKDAEERERAKALASEIGHLVCKAAPLGFGNLSLLLSFTDTVPNNSLPLIHSSNPKWRALFERPKN